MRIFTKKPHKASRLCMIGAAVLLYAGMSSRAAEPVQGYDYYEEETEQVQEDFLSWYEENPDFVGWLTAGDNIDHPVVQRDNDYYLHHDYYGNDSEDGILFVNEFNLLWPRDWMVIIHGHHMKSGAMFGRLRLTRIMSFCARIRWSCSARSTMRKMYIMSRWRPSTHP